MITIYGDECTDTIILLHGRPSIYGYMMSLGKHLKGYRVIDYAQRGTIENPAPLDEVGVLSHMLDLDLLVNKYRQKGTVTLLGHSWGADLALLYAADRGEGLEHVILMGTAPLNGELESILERNFKKKLQTKTHQELELLDSHIKDASSPAEMNRLAQKRLALISPAYHWNPITEWNIPAVSFDFHGFLQSKISLWEMINQTSIPRILQRISVPVTAFHGVEDIIPCDETLRFLQQYIQHITTIRIEKAGHFLWLEPEVGETFINMLHKVIAATLPSMNKKG